MMKKIFFLFSSFCLISSACESATHPSKTNGNSEGRVNNKKQARVQDPSDRLLTQKIRQTLIDDESLSSQAKNVIIITLNGVVTLRGAVDSEREKANVGKLAKTTFGVRSVDNQIEVMGNTSILNAPADVK